MSLIDIVKGWFKGTPCPECEKRKKQEEELKKLPVPRRKKKGEGT